MADKENGATASGHVEVAVKAHATNGEAAAATAGVPAAVGVPVAAAGAGTGAAPAPAADAAAAKPAGRKMKKVKRKDASGAEVEVEEEDLPPVPYGRLYRFATQLDIGMIVVAMVCAAVAGTMLPLTAVFLGDLSAGMNDPLHFDEVVDKAALRLTLCGVGSFVATYLANVLSLLSSARQARRMREAYFAALLRMDAAWHDTHRPGEVAARMVGDTISVQDGIGEKVAQAIQYLAQFLAGIVIAFVASWKMSLVLLSFLPLMAISGAAITAVMQKSDGAGQDAYARAGEAADQALAAIRTVVSFGGQRAEGVRYDTYLAVAEKAGIKKGMGLGFTLGALMSIMMIEYGVGLYYSSTLIIDSRNADPICITAPASDGCFSGGTAMQCLFAMIMGSMSLGQSAPAFGAMAGARTTATSLVFGIGTNPRASR